ncbi:putative ankyrin repeat domain-containing protein 19 [Phodopus roborovskii]|uniref:putative ankyrin repeat domain-containing protein 19 n=1 Tax=Phodopus roborovskii TaxID=109678 RepID=UPI0021E49671|nr:putative ankyrin repeat domain-containing protein 19 [Phodopus roborovskii]
MGGKCSRGGEKRPGGSQGFSVLCCDQKKSFEETPLGFCDIKARRNNLCFGTQNPSYLDMAYFPDNDLHMAACAGDLPFVRLYFTLGKYEVNHRDKENRNALHFACFYGHLEMVNYLWRRGCEINVCDKHNITPLMKAVQSWEEDIVCYLLERHANLHIKDSSGNTALHYAVYGGTPTMAARLLQYGANIEERTKDNLTPLLLALRENRLKMAQFLVKMEASVHAVDSQRRNSLMYAVRCDSSVMVNLLLQQGVDMNFKDLFGWTALRYAVEGDREVRTMLLEYEYNLIQSLREKNSGLPTKLVLGQPHLQPPRFVMLFLGKSFENLGKCTLVIFTSFPNSPQTRHHFTNHPTSGPLKNQRTPNTTPSSTVDTVQILLDVAFHL